MNIILFDNQQRDHFLPFTYTRPVAEIRIGILTITEKWKNVFDASPSFLTQDYLSKKYSAKFTDDNLYINGRLMPSLRTIKKISALKEGDSLVYNDTLLAFRSSKKMSLNDLFSFTLSHGESYDAIPFILEKITDIFSKNEDAISLDFEALTRGKKSQELNASTLFIGDKSHLFIEEGAKVYATSINTLEGYVYIGKNSEIMEGSCIRGSLALCEGSTIKMGAKIYGATTIGPHSKVGGEVNNSVIFGYSNKGHDGFLGNSVLGEWCNLGADTNNSNLKNNYAEVRLWDYPSGRFAHTGLTFCGLMLGDHSKSAINTMFNTGTVVGVSANIFGSGFPRNFIPSFTWGGSQEYALKKVIEVAKIVYARRKKELTDEDVAILSHIFDVTKQYRK